MDLANKSEISARDYIDAYSTLFAVKSPGYRTGYDTRVATIDTLLASTVGKCSEDDAGPTVFLSNGAKDLAGQRMVEF